MKAALRNRFVNVLDRSGALQAIRAINRVRAEPRLTVVTYHRVCDPKDIDAPLLASEVIDADVEEFDRQMAEIARDFQVVTTPELIDGLDGGGLPPNAAMVTFDDGYRECLDIVLPILERHGIRGVFFIPTAFIGERRLYWWDRIDYMVDAATSPEVRIDYPYPLTVPMLDKSRAKRFLHRVVKNVAEMDLDRFLDELGQRIGVAWTKGLEAQLVSRLVMTWDDIRVLRDRGMDIQSHTRSHRPLHTLSAEALAFDLTSAKNELQRELGSEVTAISYPVGRRVVHRRHLCQALADAGYRVGFTNGSGVNRNPVGIDRFDLRRLAIDRDTSLADFKAMITVPQLAHVSFHNR